MNTSHCLRPACWTSAEVRQRAHGDADAWSIHDYHVAKDITYALVGEPLDDAACLEILEPYRGHRYRVQLLLSLSAARRPRRAPRMTLPTHTPLFVVLVIGVLVVVTGLTYFPALALGPLAEGLS